MNEESCIRQACEASVINPRTLSECTNEKTIPYGIEGPLTAKIPVVLAEPVVQVDVESVIRLEQPALEIKRIRKNVYLTQCKLLNTGGCKKGKLFISGFVRKNIEYATDTCEDADNGVISGDIRHTTARVPFECVTEVDLINPPIICNHGFVKEVEIYTDKLVGCDPCAQNIMGRNPCEQDFEHFECFTEKIFCELVDVKIFEEDIHQNPTYLGCEFPTEQIFQEFVEKMVLFIKIKVLQKQQVNIPKKCDHKDKKCDDRFKDDDFKKERGKWRYEHGEWRPCK